MQPLKRRLPFLGLTLLHYLATAQEVTRPFSTQDAIDTVAIQQTINLYAIAADQKRFDVLPQIFTSDVTVNFNTAGVPVLHGLNAVTSFMSSALRDVVSYHVQSTHYVHLANTPTPNATTYNSATFFSASERGTQVVTRLGRYEDRLVRSSQGWRISSRTLVIIADNGNPSLAFPGGEPVAFV